MSTVILVRIHKKISREGVYLYPENPDVQITEPRTRYAYRFKNDYLFEIESLQSDVVQSIVNTLAAAERQILLSHTITYAQVFDLTLNNGVNSSPSVIFYPSKFKDLLDKTKNIVSKVDVVYAKKDPTQLSGYSFPKLTDYYLDRGCQPPTDKGGFLSLPIPERALIISRNKTSGRKEEHAYYGTVLPEDIGIMENGSLFVNYSTNLYVRRVRRYYAYMRYLSMYATDKVINKNGKWEQKGFTCGKASLSRVSDMKMKKRIHDMKPIFVIEAENQMKELVEEFGAKFSKYNDLSIHSGLNANYYVPCKTELVPICLWLKKMLRFMYAKFPYITSYETLDANIFGDLEVDTYKSLVTKSSYLDLQTNFMILWGYFDYFNGILKMVHEAPPQSFYRYNPIYLEDYLAFTGRDRFSFTSQAEVNAFYVAAAEWKVSEINKAISLMPEYRNSMIGLQTVINWIDSQWNMEAFIKGNERVIPKRNDGLDRDGNVIFKRGRLESGKPKYSKREMKKIPREPSSVTGNVSINIPQNFIWYHLNHYHVFTTYDFSNLEHIPANVLDLFKSFNPRPGIVEAKNPKPRFRWDNTIHPLTAEEEDAEAISLLEEMEENGRAVFDALKFAAKWYARRRYGGGASAGIGLVIDLVEQVTIGEINPTDREKLAIPLTTILIEHDGSIPINREGWKFSITLIKKPPFKNNWWDTPGAL